MYSTDRTPFSQPTIAQQLLHGEPVTVTLVANEQTPHEMLKGTLTGVDSFGLLLDRGDHGAVFIPWSSVRYIGKPKMV